jgi:hypothetical protein
MERETREIIARLIVDLLDDPLHVIADLFRFVLARLLGFRVRGHGVSRA